ncbi:MAG TPA: hypothetical protein VIJ72_01560, partial [Rhizomicrobium sp.]
GETQSYPVLPRGYFEPRTEAVLHDLAADAAQDSARLSDLVTLSVPEHAWRNSTVQLFANWLRGVAAQKARREAPAQKKRA